MSYNLLLNIQHNLDMYYSLWVRQDVSGVDAWLSVSRWASSNYPRTGSDCISQNKESLLDLAFGGPFDT